MMKRLGDYIRPVDVRNRDLKVTRLLGVSITKEFMPSIANIVGTDLSAYKVVTQGQFAYGPVTSRNGDKISVALLDGYDDAIISQAYTVFEIVDTNALDPEYLMMWFRRPEFDRYARFHSHGSAREVFDWEEMCEVQVPVPAIEKQREIVAEYNTLATRIETNKKLIATLEQTAQTLYRHTFVDNIDPNNLPDGWRMGTVEEMSEKIIAGVIPKYNEKSFFAVLGQKCIRNHSVDLDLVKYHDPKENCEYLKYGDILINSTGDGTLGRSGQVLFVPDKLAFDSNMTLVRPLKEHYIEYLGYLIFGKQDYFIRISQGSTNQTRLYCSMVRPVELVIPTEDVLESFSKNVRCMNSLIHTKRMEIKNLLKMQTLLLSKMGA